MKMTKWLSIFFLITSLNFPLAVSAEEQPIAILNGQVIPNDQVESRAATKLYRLRWEIYDTLKTEAQALVDERLLAEAAKAKGLTGEELIQAEVDAKAKPATDADVNAYIQEHKVEDTSEETRSRIKTYLTDRARIQVKLDLQEKLRKTAKYEFLLQEPERPRMQVSLGNKPFRGAADAPVTIIHFASFTCEHCAESTRKIQRLTEDFPGMIRWIHRDFLNIFDELGLAAAEAGAAANAQGKFWEFHDKLYALSGEFSEDELKKILADVGIDAGQYEKAHKEASYIMGIKDDIEDGAAAGVTSVPAIFINGRYISGTFPYEKLKAMVEEELQAARPEAQKDAAVKTTKPSKSSR